MNTNNFTWITGKTGGIGLELTELPATDRGNPTVAKGAQELDGVNHEPQYASLNYAV